MKDRIENTPVKLKDGSTTTVKKWLAEVSLQLPQCFRYKAGAKAGELVDHYTELLEKFKEDGKFGVAEYVDGCYKILDKELAQKTEE